MLPTIDPKLLNKKKVVKKEKAKPSSDFGPA
jgi:hypothetical protein